MEIPEAKLLPKIEVVKSISDLKCPVFLSKDSNNENGYYALKIFKYKHGQLNQGFLNELHFLKLDHPHILVPQYWEYERRFN